MLQYIANRILLFFPTLLLVSIIVFILMSIIPGDPAKFKLQGDRGEGQYTQEALDALRHRLGTDRSLPVQYLNWVWGMVRGDFGISLFYEDPISEDIKQKLPVTMELAFLGIILSVFLSVPLGVIAAVKQDSPVDYLARFVAITGIAMPNFWVAVLVIYFLVKVFNWFPPLDYEQFWVDPWQNIQQMFIPAMVAAFYNMALIARVARSSMLEVYREDYVRTARSKGLTENAVTFRHAFRNALLPVVTVSGWQFARLIAGSVIIEYIFLLPGIGAFMVDHILLRDMPVVQAVTMVVTAMTLLLNLFVDLLYAWLDPRIRYA